MRMSSLRDSIALLESDLKAVPPRINVYHDLPFAIMRYDPIDEWELRREIRLLATRLEAAGKEVHVVPSITTTAVSRANEGVDATGFKEAPFRSRRKCFCCRCIKPRLALFRSQSSGGSSFVLHQPSIRSVLPTMILRSNSRTFGGRQGAHSTSRPYLQATG